MRRYFLFACGFLALVFSGCTLTPRDEPPTLPPVAPATGMATPATGMVAPAEEPAGTATIRGSEESSMMLDNFTAFIVAVDGQPIAAGRDGWNTPIELKAGHRELTVEFRRGVFSARTLLVVEARAKANYQLKYTTDAQLFGNNSYCDFWVIDLATGRPVTDVRKAPVVKGG